MTRRVSIIKRRQLFGRALARRVKDEELTKAQADMVLEDYARTMAHTERGERIVRRSLKRAYQRIAPATSRNDGGRHVRH